MVRSQLQSRREGWKTVEGPLQHCEGVLSTLPASPRPPMGGGPASLFPHYLLSALGVLWAMDGSGGFPSVFSLPLLYSIYRRSTLLKNGCRWNLGGGRILYSMDLHCVESIQEEAGKTIMISCLLTGVGTWAHSSRSPFT